MDDKKAEWVEKMRKLANDTYTKATAEEDQFKAWMNDRMPDDEDEK